MSSDSSQRIDLEELNLRLSDFDAHVDFEASGAFAPCCVVTTGAETSLATLAFLRDDPSMSMRRLVDLTAVDRLGRSDVMGARFMVVYQLHSPNRQQRMRVEVSLPDMPHVSEAGDGSAADEMATDGAMHPVIDSATRLWEAASWLECEVYDLFGIHFSGHPELRRILLDAEFQGSPLRKDHALRLDRRFPVERRT